MIIRTSVVIALFAGLLPVISLARIGDTPEACMVRYGNAIYTHKISATRERALYKKDRMNIETTFYKGRCEWIDYWAEAAPNIWHKEGKILPLSGGEINYLLHANSEQQDWSKEERRLPGDHNTVCWTSEDGKMRATYYEIHMRLSICTYEAINHWMSDMQESSRTQQEIETKEAGKTLQGL